MSLDADEMLVPDNDGQGAGEQGCPTATLVVMLDGPEAGMACDGDDCKFVFTLEVSPEMDEVSVEDWMVEYVSPGPDGVYETLDCPDYNSVTNDQWLVNMGAMLADDEASVTVDGEDMECETQPLTGDRVKLVCTYEIDVSCDEATSCQGGQEEPYEVSIEVAPPGQTSRELTTEFTAHVHGSDSCNCTISTVDGELGDGFDYVTTDADGNQEQWNPETGEWDLVTP